MAYFPDLSPYAYEIRGVVGEWKHRDVVHIGWLDGVHDYAKGEVAPHLVAKLKILAKHPVELYRGRHECELCNDPNWWSNGEIRVTVRTLLDGSALENVVEGIPAPKEVESGLVLYRKIAYAAPLLIAHYIEAHNYLPPAEFLKALETIPE